MSAPASTRVWPDPAVCRVQSAGFGDYVECLVDHPELCPEAQSFGMGYFCNHPQRDEILKHTLAAKG